MKTIILILVLFSSFLIKVFCIGYSDLITIGPNYYTIGINLDISLYPPNTTYNIISHVCCANFRYTCLLLPQHKSTSKFVNNMHTDLW